MKIRKKSREENIDTRSCKTPKTLYDKLMSTPKAFPKPVAAVVFLIGLISAVSFRAIILVQYFSPLLVRALWYLAVITNFLFFLFRYHISRKRKRAINAPELIAKLEADQHLDTEEREAVAYLLTSIERSHENWNYLSIFILSALAILIDLMMSLAGR